MNLILNFFSSVLDAIFPQKCVACKKDGTLLCEQCLCGFPVAPPAPLPFIHSVFDYQHSPTKNTLWRFKYKNARGFAKVFAERLYEEIIAELSDNIDAGSDEKYLLVPVPLHKSRLRERGYNQSSLLAKEIAKYDRSGMFEFAPDVLKRVRKTKPQARAEKRSARQANLHGAFTCSDYARVHGRTIILIDDITTTGATLLASKKALSLARPRKVLAFTIAH
ncbi:MAG: ComF family protein [Candidatus Yonathbacteria bacterium]|nr:ComF family protein [Candidatus Yonathbacteria bacterium]